MKNPDMPVGFVIQGATTTELPDEVVRESLLAVQLLRHGRNPLACECPDSGADQLVLLAEVEVQPESAVASSTMSRTP